MNCDKCGRPNDPGYVGDVMLCAYEWRDAEFTQIGSLAQATLISEMPEDRYEVLNAKLDRILELLEGGAIERSVIEKLRNSVFTVRAGGA